MKISKQQAVIMLWTSIASSNSEICVKDCNFMHDMI